MVGVEMVKSHKVSVIIVKTTRLTTGGGGTVLLSSGGQHFPGIGHAA